MSAMGELVLMVILSYSTFYVCNVYISITTIRSDSNAMIAPGPSVLDLGEFFF